MIDKHSLASDYKRNGYVSHVPILNENETAKLRRQLKAFINEYGQHPQFNDWCYFKSHLLLPWIADLAHHPNVIAATSALLGPDLLLWNSFIPCKPPNSEGLFGWHQDATYWQIKPLENVFTLWLAVGDVTPDNGGMKFIAKSHKGGQLPHDITFDPKSMLRRGQRITEPFSDKAVVNGDLLAGEASIHHPLTIHGSGPNQSNDWRYGISFNIVAADVELHPDYPESACYLSGKDRNREFAREQFPSVELSNAAIEEFERAENIAAARYANSHKSGDADE